MRRGLKLGFFLTLAVSAAVLAASIPKGVDVDLYSLVGDDGGLVTALARKTSSLIRVLPRTAEGAAAARRIVPAETRSPREMLDFLSAHGRGLLGEKHRRLLEAGETNRVARSALRRDYSGIGLFPGEIDPYYFLNDFVMELRAFRPSSDLLVGPAAGVEELLGLSRRGEVYLSGAPFHTHLATESSRREINVLGTVSVAAVFLLGYLLFRGFRFVLPVAAALGSGFLVASAAVFLLPGRPHLLVFLFGTSLIGLGVDYCYHGLAGAETRKLTAALVTTSLAFSPLLFSSLPVLNQMAVFTISGLVAIYAFTVLCLRRI